MALLVLFGVVLLLGTTMGVDGARLASKQDPKTIEELWEAENSMDLAVNEQSRREEFGRLSAESCEDDSKGIPLCRECSFLRELPADYSPRYLVERKCQGQDCLMHEGKCLQQYMSVEVRNIAPDREGETILVRIAAGCRCLLNENSILKDYFLR
ncbi:uncharacterized protein LOC144925616 [Branchiostoma floridae x Branchiostoma belcheri]